MNDVFVDPKDSRRVLIATNRGGVMGSDDGGDTFRSSNGGFSARQITAMKRDSGHPATLYVGIVNDKEWGGIFRSDNGGLVWDQRSEGLQGRDVFSLGQAPDGTMIAGTAHGLYRLDMESKTWARVTNAPAGHAAAANVRAAIAVVRAPVPIGRNEFAERRTSLAKSSSKTSATHKVSSATAKRSSAAALRSPRLKSR